VRGGAGRRRLQARALHLGARARARMARCRHLRPRPPEDRRCPQVYNDVKTVAECAHFLIFRHNGVNATSDSPGGEVKLRRVRVSRERTYHIGCVGRTPCSARTRARGACAGPSQQSRSWRTPQCLIMHDYHTLTDQRWATRLMPSRRRARARHQSGSAALAANGHCMTSAEVWVS